jgi:hypothetical protein
MNDSAVEDKYAVTSLYNELASAAYLSWSTHYLYNMSKRMVLATFEEGNVKQYLLDNFTRLRILPYSRLLREIEWFLLLNNIVYPRVMSMKDGRHIELVIIAGTLLGVSSVESALLLENFGILKGSDEVFESDKLYSESTMSAWISSELIRRGIIKEPVSTAPLK